MNYETAYVVAVASPMTMTRYMTTTKRGTKVGSVAYTYNVCKATWFTLAQAFKKARAMRAKHPLLYFYAKKFNQALNA